MESTEIKTVLSITGVAKFVTLAAAEPHPDFPDQGARYRIEMVTPKANQTELRPLMEAAQHVARRTWVGAEQVKRWKGVLRTIKEGDGESTGTIGLLDGDQYKPEYNAGTYVVKASARANQRPAYRRWDEAKGKYALTDKAPEPGDLVRVLLEVWAMKQHPRINLTIKAVQVMQGGEKFMPISGGQVVTEEQIEEELSEAPQGVLSLFEGMRSGGLAAVGSGIVEEPVKQVAAPKAAKAAKATKAAKTTKAAPAPPVTYDEDEPDSGDFDLDGADDPGPSEGDGLFDNL